MKTLTGKVLILIVACGLIFGAGALVEQPLASSRDSAKAIASLHSSLRQPCDWYRYVYAHGHGVKIIADINGLTPGEHGFHIHQWGDCSAADGTSAGGHYNPFNTAHGSPMDEIRHVGDLGNIKAGSDGSAHYESDDAVVSLDGPTSVIGRAVIVHAGKDDFTSQPTGNAGGRVACGVIGYAHQ